MSVLYPTGSGGNPSGPPTTESPVTPAPAPNFLRRNRRWIAIGLLGLSGVFTIFVGGFAYLAFQVHQIRKVSVEGLRPAGSGQPQNILIVGSDSRAGMSAADAQHFGSQAQVQGQRSDVIAIVHLDPRTGGAAMLSIPRDLFVPIAGEGAPNRINVAFGQGPSVLVKTISADFGITINHVIQEDFSGLQTITDAVGGVCLNFPMPVRDGAPSGPGNESGLNIPTAGKQTIHGAMALSLVRSRYYQYFSNGSWHAEGTGDIGRIERQHQYVRALATKTIHAALGNPFTANAVLRKAVAGIILDDSFTSIGIMRLAINLRGVHPAAMPSWTLPYTAANNYRGFGDVLLPATAQDAAVISAWQNFGAPGTTAPTAAPATVPPGAITVRVLNGSGVAGQAQRTASELRAAGFNVSGYSTAPSSAGGATVISYAAGQTPLARTLADRVVGAVSLHVDAGLRGSTVVVTTGTGFGGIRATTAPTAPSAAPAAPTAPPWDPTSC